MPSTIASPPSRSAAAPGSACCAAARDMSVHGGAAHRAGHAARRDHHPRALAVLRRQGRQPVAGAGRRIAARQYRPRASSSSTSPTAPMPAISASSAATSSSSVNDQQHRQRRAISTASPACASRTWRIVDQARRPADFRGVRRMSLAMTPRAKAARPEPCSPPPGLDQDAPRPLADRLRPQTARRGGGAGSSARARRRADAHAGDALARLAGVLGPARHRQDHGGAAAGAGDRPAFRADLGDLHRRRRPEEGVRGGARAAARPGRARCCSSTRSTASTAPSRTVSCR